MSWISHHTNQELPTAKLNLLISRPQWVGRRALIYCYHYPDLGTPASYSLHGCGRSLWTNSAEHSDVPLEAQLISIQNKGYICSWFLDGTLNIKQLCIFLFLFLFSFGQINQVFNHSFCTSYSHVFRFCSQIEYTPVYTVCAMRTCIIYWCDWLDEYKSHGTGVVRDRSATVPWDENDDARERWWIQDKSRDCLCMWRQISLSNDKATLWILCLTTNHSLGEKMSVIHLVISANSKNSFHFETDHTPQAPPTTSEETAKRWWGRWCKWYQIMWLWSGKILPRYFLGVRDSERSGVKTTEHQCHVTYSQWNHYLNCWRLAKIRRVI